MKRILDIIYLPCNLLFNKIITKLTVPLTLILVSSKILCCCRHLILGCIKKLKLNLITTPFLAFWNWIFRYLKNFLQNNRLFILFRSGYILFLFYCFSYWYLWMILLSLYFITQCLRFKIICIRKLTKIIS